MLDMVETRQFLGSHYDLEHNGMPSMPEVHASVIKLRFKTTDSRARSIPVTGSSPIAAIEYWSYRYTVGEPQEVWLGKARTVQPLDHQLALGRSPRERCM